MKKHIIMDFFGGYFLVGTFGDVIFFLNGLLDSVSYFVGIFGHI